MRTRFVESYGGRDDWPDATFGDCAIRAFAEVMSRRHGAAPSIHHYITSWKVFFEAEREKGNIGMPWSGIHAWDGIWCGAGHEDEGADVLLAEPDCLHLSGTIAEVSSRFGGFTVSAGVLLGMPTVRLRHLSQSHHRLMDSMSKTRIVWFNTTNLDNPDKHVSAWIDGKIYDTSDPCHMPVLGFTFFSPLNEEATSPPQRTKIPGTPSEPEHQTEDPTP